MTRADNAHVALGRSRDTWTTGVAPFPAPAAPELPPRQRVILRVWGYSHLDAQKAEDDARIEARKHRLEIIQVVTTTGGISPIRPRDVMAVDQGANFDRMWAAYPTV